MKTRRNADVMQRLRSVVDPCSIAMGFPKNLYQMGLIESLEIDGGSVHIRLVLTDASCAFFNQIRQHVADVVRDLDWVREVSVQVDASILWTPDRMKLP